MKKTVSTGLLALAILTGCGQNVPLVVNNMDHEDKCNAYNNKLLKVNEYISKVERTSNFHLEEAAVALQDPQISRSNNKKDMLKDANRRKTALLEELRENGCGSNIK